MLIITSISPRHKNKENQIAAIKSWQKYGNVFSMNRQDEINQIDKSEYPGIAFIPTTRTIEQLFGIPRVNINAMIDVGILHCEDILLVNSDVIIERLPELKQDGVTILSRWDYTTDFSDAIHFEFGFDIFYLPKEFLDKYPPTIYGMGSTWVDFSLVYRPLINGIKVYWPQGKFAYHKKHELQWNFDEWQRMGTFFKWEFNLDSYLQVEQIATQILADIKNRVIK